MIRVATVLRKAMLTLVVGMCYCASFCSADSAVNVEPQGIQFTDEGIFILFDGEERVNIDDVVCDSGKLISIHKHKIYCLKCFGCDPRKHGDCKSRCKCKHPKLR